MYEREWLQARTEPYDFFVALPFVQKALSKISLACVVTALFLKESGGLQSCVSVCIC